ncbi:NACHT domain-containing protein [Nostoc sp. 'Peltigera malacea cyanobiont' DB3992]|uniref:NACHT domain-containing protein n=1 Tax=Nostoc sp. 'Peltigera malacea cyanobiont' DB3992 TaxID=1206980 RepID=UPI000C03A817|nr:NACHT domain-containing NTPase [Nostoc sp. 'Peltigera malacea cyanobiont' DB3992]PHM10149.1 transcriptional regulator [Nostoc sp. 'Peltigera malacea cyanobiont' DB3992]
MSGRSLFSSPEGIQKAKRALIRYSLTQKALAKELEVTRQPIGKFLTGKPVDRNLFVQICDRLDLEWEEVVVNEPTSEPEVSQDNSIDIDAIVQEVREKIKPLIQKRCGTMRVLDMSQPIRLNDIYTSVNILDKITGQRRLGIDELLQQCRSQDFDLFGLNKITEKRVPGLEAVEKYSKLMILGKPGAGKTTFLKYLAIQCIGGEFQAERVPIFVTLKNFAEAANKPGLLQHITEETINPISSIRDILTYGKALVLLDGLDEVREEDSDRILKEIREFSDGFPKNQFVMTCRIAAKEYTFEKFTEVEVADFDDDQICNFTNKWFKDKAVKPETFIKRLEENSRIKQLATSPLLLTLLCLAFEESGDFPANRSELYKEGLDALLKKWDAKRGIQRDQIYKKLSVQRKEDLLSKIALTTFEGSEYFFKQKAAEQYITEYIRNLPDANTDEEALQLDSEQVLRSIEHHHGLVVARAKRIYSFSHLTFHEYFTAREFVVVRQSSEEALQNLVSHITEKRWREVFLLTVGMSPSADRLLLLMKEKIDALITTDEKLQDFLMWVQNKSLYVDTNYKLTAVRAFYLELGLGLMPEISLDLACSLDNTIISVRHSASNCPLCLDRDLFLVLHLNEDLLFDKINFFECYPKLYSEPAILQKKLLEITKNKSKNRKEKLRRWMIQYRNLGHDWKFSKNQKELLIQYYVINQLMGDCLNSNCYVSRKIRQQIEDTLLLPIAEIKQRQQQS